MGSSAPPVSQPLLRAMGYPGQALLTALVEVKRSKQKQWGLLQPGLGPGTLSLLSHPIDQTKSYVFWSILTSQWDEVSESHKLFLSYVLDNEVLNAHSCLLLSRTLCTHNYCQRATSTTWMRAKIITVPAIGILIPHSTHHCMLVLESPVKIHTTQSNTEVNKSFSHLGKRQWYQLQQCALVPHGYQLPTTAEVGQMAYMHYSGAAAGPSPSPMDSEVRKAGCVSRGNCCT